MVLVVRRLGVDVKADVDADVLARLLDDLGEVLHLLVVLGVQIGREPVRVTGLRQQVLGLGDILGSLGHAGVR